MDHTDSRPVRGQEYDTQAGNVVAWIALVVAAVALLLAWTAFNRSPGADIEQVIQDRVDEAREEMRTEYRQLETSFRAQTSETLRETADEVATGTATSTLEE